MDRLQAFEAMLHDIQEQCEREKKAMDELKAQPHTRSVQTIRYFRLVITEEQHNVEMSEMRSEFQP